VSAASRIHWKWVLAGGVLAEVSVIAIFFLLLLAATVAGVPEIARPMTTLDYVDAMLMSFVSMLVFTVWVGKRVDSAFVLHGLLIGILGIVLFTVMWIGTTGSLAQPALYVVAHGLKIVGGIAGGLIAAKRHERALAASAHAVTRA
jgi:hypothetical protein